MTSLIKSGYVTAIDIGSGKISCLIARVHPDNSIQIIGAGYAQSRGLKNGLIVNLQEASGSIQDAIIMAEEQAERRVDTVLVNVSSTALKSSYAAADIKISDNKPISSNDVKKVIDMALDNIDLPDHEIIHQLPMSFTIDGQVSDEAPTGLFGQSLGVVLHIISMPTTQLRNLTAALERCHVSIAAKVAAPYAAALAVLTDEEKEVGTTVLDIGGGLVGVSIFQDGFVHYTAMLPLGAHLITKDISQVVKTSIIEAERVKTLYGSAFLSPKDAKGYISVPSIEADEESTMIRLSQADLISIIVPRVEEMLELIQSFLHSAEELETATRRIVLTGGGSLLQGLREKTSAVLDAQVRLGKPANIKGLPDVPPAATYATAVGLLRYATNQRIRGISKQVVQPVAQLGKFKRTIRWLIQNF